MAGILLSQTSKPLLGCSILLRGDTANQRNKEGHPKGGLDLRASLLGPDENDRLEHGLLAADCENIAYFSAERSGMPKELDANDVLGVVGVNFSLVQSSPAAAE